MALTLSRRRTSCLILGAPKSRLRHHAPHMHSHRTSPCPPEQLGHPHASHAPLMLIPTLIHTAPPPNACARIRTHDASPPMLHTPRSLLSTPHHAAIFFSVIQMLALSHTANAAPYASPVCAPIFVPQLVGERSCARRGASPPSPHRPRCVPTYFRRTSSHANCQGPCKHWIVVLRREFVIVCCTTTMWQLSLYGMDQPTPRRPSGPDQAWGPRRTLQAIHAAQVQGPIPTGPPCPGVAAAGGLHAARRETSLRAACPVLEVQCNSCRQIRLHVRARQRGFGVPGCVDQTDLISATGPTRNLQRVHAGAHAPASQPTF